MTTQVSTIENHSVMVDDLLGDLCDDYSSFYDRETKWHCRWR